MPRVYYIMVVIVGSLEPCTGTPQTRTCLQAVDKPRARGIGYELVDARVEKAEGHKCRPLAPVVYLETHEYSVLSRTDVHVGHVERPEAVEDHAHCNHPHYQQRHSVSSVGYKFSVF